MNMKSSKINNPHKFVLNLSQRLDLRSSNIHFALRNLSIYYAGKNVRKTYKNNELQIIAPMWNYKFELPDGLYSVSDIQDYIEYFIKETLTIFPPTHI